MIGCLARDVALQIAVFHGKFVKRTWQKGSVFVAIFRQFARRDPTPVSSDSTYFALLDNSSVVEVR